MMLALVLAAAAVIPSIDPDTAVVREAAGAHYVLVDVRSPQAYAQEHLPEAVSLPVDALDRLAGSLPHDRQLLLYCTCPAEHGSLAAARKLHDRYHFTRLSVLRGGMEAWRDAGYPLERGPKADKAATD